MADVITSDDTVAWNAALDAAAAAQFKKRLMKDAAFGSVALSFVIGFVNWPQPWVVVVGVITIITLVCVSEAKSKPRERWPPKGRAVVITGCDTGE